MNEGNSSKFYNIGLSYKKADVATRSKFSISPDNQIKLLNTLKQKGSEGAVVISTCNRIEIFGFAKHPFELIEELCNYSDGTVDEIIKVCHVFKSYQAIDYAFRIATGLDSQILGDYEIVGQLKIAFKQAKKAGATNMFLERLFNAALHASKQVKNNTKLSSGTTTVAYAAIQYLQENCEMLNNKKMVLYGLGNIGKHTALNIKEYIEVNNVVLINRTFEKAQQFAEEYCLSAQKEENLKAELQTTDILIVATGSSKPTINLELIPTDKNITILDLSIPSNVAAEVGNLANVKLINVDELSKITDKTIALRQMQIPFAEAIIEENKKELLEWVEGRKHTPALKEFKQYLEVLQNEGIDYYKKKNPDFDIAQAELITSHIIQKITTKFAKHLKHEDTQIGNSIELIRKIFEVEV
ncbi:MAG: glutamyl-tRNA reductase [Flavobacteriales bacterium CG_4_10_14_0_2_um_filter_35_18]|nr:MAG: glutamyl-tRNA reductase [Flavobacteriales bacterium CG_4_10_14_0_2_um_filter_35_18]